jgi:G3E family GTPase
MTDAGISDRLAVGGVVTTVDAVNGAGTLACEEISVKQVALADQLILTKSDLLEGTDLPEQTAALLLARLASLNAAPLVWADRGKVDPRLFGAASFDARIKSRDIEAWLTGRGGQNGDRHSHDARIGSYAILRHEPIHAVALTLFLEALTEHCGTDLLRLKGIVNVAESPESPAVIHGVQHVFHAPIWLPRWPSDDRRSRIVCITRCVPQGWVEALLDALNAEVAAVSAEQKDVL